MDPIIKNVYLRVMPDKSVIAVEGKYLPVFLVKVPNDYGRNTQERKAKAKKEVEKMFSAYQINFHEEE